MTTGAPSFKVFNSPKELVWGRGSVQYLENVQGKKALIVTDKILVKVGAVARVENYLKKTGMAIQVFDDVEPEFVPNTITKMLEQCKGFTPDIVIGLGGGSAIDASKAFRIFYEHPELTFKDIWPIAGPPKKAIPPLTKTISITIPTTSGTGSEVSPAFVVSDPETNDKRAALSKFLMATVAIVDPDFTDSMPKTVQIDSGLDALSHSVASYVSTFGNDFSGALAIQAVKLVMKNLLAASQGDKEAKGHMHYAACLAGQAFANSGLGIEHYIGHILGARFHLSHGRACAVVLPHAVRFNANAAADKLMEIAVVTGYRGKNKDEATNYVVDQINSLMKQLGVGLTLRENGVAENAFTAELPGFLQDFARSTMLPPLMSNPGKGTVDTIKELYNAIYYGKNS
jgi:acetaldehyde dehydrogenase/alcohol dehydrogenase